MGQDQQQGQTQSARVSDKDLEKVSGGCDLAELTDASQRQSGDVQKKSGKAGALRRLWNEWFG